MRKVKSLKAHSAIFIPGGGAQNLGDTLPPSNKTIVGLEMFFSTEGVLVRIPGRDEVILPWANLQVAVLGPETVEAPKVVKKA